MQNERETNCSYQATHLPTYTACARVMGTGQE